MQLSDLRGKRVVLYCSPKVDTPGCMIQARGFRDALPRTEQANAVVFGISPDDVQSHRAFKARYQFPCTLLVDKDHAMA